MAGGRPPNPNPLREKYKNKYKLNSRKVWRLTPRFLEQLENCKNEAARKILLRGLQ